ncbi:alpha/beta hydrolase [Microcystis aeruginosa]|nr:alpha/beta hydrolase [Microcystis aeruginosa]
MVFNLAHLALKAVKLKSSYTLSSMLIEQLFFYPDSHDYGCKPSSDKFHFEDIYITLNPHVKIHGWFVPSEDLPKATIIHFHGNAANITNHWEQVSWIPRQKYNLFTFDYRGFGQSTGEIRFSGIHDDCLSVIRYVRTKLDNTGKLIILGQSIGGAFCVSAVAEDQSKDIKGIILDSCFDSFQNIAIAKLFMIPSSLASLASNLLLSDKYSPIRYLDSIKIPKLIIHSESDQVVPFKLGCNLFNSASDPKKFLSVKHEDHISFFINRVPENMSIVFNFLANCLA